jgi:hypothetical protein
MKLWVTAIIGLFAMLMVSMPVRAAVGPESWQPPVIQALYPQAQYGHWYRACRDPRFRRHHPFLCW